MKRILSVLLVAVLSIGLLTACGGGGTTSPSPSASTPPSTPPELTGWDYIIDRGVLLVGLDDTFAPMGFRDEANNLVGFDIDLANAVGAYLDIEIQFQPIDWDAKFIELDAKRIDCIWNGMSVTPERIEKLSLSGKYLNNRIIVMALDPDVTVASVEDLANLKIGTQVDSAALEFMQGHEAYDTFAANISEYPDYDEVVLELQAGRIDVMVIDESLGEYKNSKLDEGSKFTVCEFNFGEDYYVVGCRKGDPDVAAKLTEAIAALVESGKAAEISEAWFGRDIISLGD